MVGLNPKNFSLAPGERTDAMNSDLSSHDFNKPRRDAAGKEYQQPVKSLAGGIKNSILNVLRGAGQFVTDIVTAPVAIAANIGRYVMDITTKIPARAALAAADTISENTFGRISRIARYIKEKIYSKLGIKENDHGAVAEGNGPHATHDIARAAAKKAEQAHAAKPAAANVHKIAA